jgi:hypothetical protein
MTIARVYLLVAPVGGVLIVSHLSHFRRAAPGKKRKDRPPQPTNGRIINTKLGSVSISHCDEVPMEVAVGQQWGIFSRKVQRWAVATVISVENGTVNLKYRDYRVLPHRRGRDTDVQ